ncbi:MAG TPA: hypothetical protein VGQ76_20325 [Thermoanaerobaculia bacterium]|nr:hypothetical protein [Thermoanaerobaculia bacterium]
MKHQFKPPAMSEGPWLLESMTNQFSGNYVKEPLNKSRFCDAVENEVVADTALTLKSGDASAETADICRVGVAEQRQADQA